MPTAVKGVLTFEDSKARGMGKKKLTWDRHIIANTHAPTEAMPLSA